MGVCFVRAVLLTLAATPCEAAAGYDLPPGTEVKFAVRSAETVEGKQPAKPSQERETVAWVVAENPDHSKRILLLEDASFRVGKWRCWYPAGALFDLDPAGGCKLIRRFGQVDPAFYFPRLPPEPGPPADTLTVTSDAPELQAQSVQRRTTYRLDPQTGVCTSATHVESRNGPAAGSSTLSVERLSTRVADDRERAELMKQGEKFFDLTDAYRAALRDAHYNPAAAGRARDPAGGGGHGHAAGPGPGARPLDDEPVGEQFAVPGERAKFSPMVGRPAPAFTANDLDGRSHRLADYGGKVVVLDFWNRSCPPCMANIPAFVKLAKRYEGRPVAFIGMYTTDDPQNARLAADALRIPYPTLQSAHLLDAYAANVWPTIVVIDAGGVFRHVQVGMEDVEGELTPVIERLLGPPR